MLKVGALQFTNAYPLFYALREKIIPNNLIFSGTAPSDVNGMLDRGAVDVALISSVSFLANRFSYILLSDLGIAGTEEIMSVRLFFKGNRPLLDNAPVYVPEISFTSIHLFKKICSHFWHVSPQILTYSGPPEELFKQEIPFLLIGDMCLEYHDQKTHSSFDLGKVWHDATKTSFIFAVVATRNDAFARSPQEVMDFHRLLEDSFQWSLQNREVIVEAAAKKMGCSKELVRRYYSTIEYRLLPKHFHGLDHFAGLEG